VRRGFRPKGEMTVAAGVFKAAAGATAADVSVALAKARRFP
jgi:hypothetical protein